MVKCIILGMMITLIWIGVIISAFWVYPWTIVMAENAKAKGRSFWNDGHSFFGGIFMIVLSLFYIAFAIGGFLLTFAYWANFPAVVGSHESRQAGLVKKDGSSYTVRDFIEPPGDVWHTDY